MSGIAAGVAAIMALAGAVAPAAAGDAANRPTRVVTLPAVAGPLAVQTVVFPGRLGPPVRVVRGATRPSRRPPRPAVRRPSPALARPANDPVSAQIVSFGDGTATRVTVIRGAAFMPASLVRRIDPLRQPRIETVSFGNPAMPVVRIFRGPSSAPLFSADLFAPANAGELDRVAFAVDGIESRHGTDLRMWRPEINGPQGPMQISAAAAFDVGGGDRFDLRQNRMLGRAYLAQMFQRYGNWVDALAAYNWGPGNVDQWIAGGHNPALLPPEVIWYVSKALRDALILTAGR